MTRSSVAVLISAVVMITASARPAQAQIYDPTGSQTGASGNIDGFAVAGRGVAAAKPNRLEIELEVSAASELTADAIVKYRDAKKRLQDAFSGLKMGNVKVEERGLNVDQKGQAINPYYMEMPVARRGKVEVQLKRKLVVTCAEIRDMDEETLLKLVAKLLDVAQDAGGKIGGQPEYNPYYGYNPYNRGGGGGMVRFILDDFDALQEKAYGEAIADARSKASRLAKLSGVELGRVAGIREVVVPGERASVMGMGGDDEVHRKRLESTKFQDIPIRVELQVRFDLAAAAKSEKREGTK
ncbi:MAG: hypothetical protein JWN86_3207 [Planctomycetota bacterium]|nr:hypothetical protein [Planctomycetota bacterium]